MTDGLFSVQDKVAVITGGSGVLGGAMAKELGRRGAKVAVVGRSVEKTTAVSGQIEADAGVAMPLSVDVTDRTACENAAAAVLEKWGKIDFLVNAAGGNHPDATASPPEKQFFDLPSDALRFAIDLNLMGTILPCQTFGKAIAQQEAGSIVNISSMAALRPLTKVIGYSAAKAAVSNFTDWLSVYMCQNHSKNIRVNAIAPGFFLTEQNRYLLTDKKTGEYTPRGQSVIDQTPMDRFGEPDELLGTLVWLLAPASSFVTGTVIPVDGGFSAFSGV